MAVLGALLVIAVGTAHAARLDVRAGVLTAESAGHPCPGTLAVTTTSTGSSSSVRVTAPTTCAGRTVAVAVPAGTAVRQGSGVLPPGGTLDVALDGAFTPSTALAVQATVSGWHLPVTWTWAGRAAITPGNAWTGMTQTWRTQGTTVCVDVSVWTTTSQRWRIALDTTASPFNGATSGYQLSPGWAQLESPTPVGGMLHIDGGPGANGTRPATNPAVVTICLPNPPPAP